MQVSKVWIFIFGILAGAVFLGDDGGQAVREMFSGLRQGASSIFGAGGEGFTEFGGSIGE